MSKKKLLIYTILLIVIIYFLSSLLANYLVDKKSLGFLRAPIGTVIY